MNPSKPVVNVVSAVQTDEYRLRIGFDDGTEREIDFKPFLNGSHHPSLRAYLDAKRFQSFRIEFGDLVWGDYEMCFPVMDLYQGQIDHKLPLSAAA